MHMEDDQWRKRQDFYTLMALKKKREQEDKKYRELYGEHNEKSK